MTGPTVKERLRSVPLWLIDVGLATVFVLVVTVELLRQPLPSTQANLTAAALTAIMAGCLALRRRAPVTVYVVAGTALLAESFLGVATEQSPLATFIGSYSVGKYASRRRAWWGPPITVVAVVAVFAAGPGLNAESPARVGSVVFTWLAAWTVGYSFARRAEEQERTRRAIERQVVAEERIRMSRELHDLVGHTVNLLVVQAGAARLTIDTDPAKTRELLRGMEETGRETLAELDGMLATLRADPALDDVAALVVHAAPGLAGLPELVERFHDSGVAAKLIVEPELDLPPEVDVTAYRIVQEALTNALKHAAPCAASVLVERVDGSLLVEVTDTGPGALGTDDHGRGLVGIAERVSPFGGKFEYGNGTDGGFRVRAVLPVS